jgi:Domain of unknown function (DUF4157)/Bacterial toxin 34
MPRVGLVPSLVFCNPGGTAVFAPKVAKPQTRAPEGSTSKLAPWRSALDRLGHDPVKQALFLQRSVVPAQLSQKCAACGDEERQQLQTKPTGAPVAAGSEALGVVHEVLRMPGQPLDAEMRAFFEGRFGYDFSRVRIRSDERAAKSAEAVNARAYTVGNDIVFGAGEWSPHSDAGKRLLAHELTHVVQQTESRQSPAVQREAGDLSRDTPSPTTAAPDASARLLRVIEGIESAYTAAQRDLAEGETDPQVQEYGQTLRTMLERMKAVAGGDDEALKQQVLAGFTAKQIERAEGQAKETAGSAPASRPGPAGLAMKSLEVGSPRDAAEVEADKVADLVMSGARVPSILARPRRLGAGGILSRQLGPQLVAAGSGILVADAEVAPETGPPGWVVGGVIALAALAVIGVGLLMSSASNVADTGIMEEARTLIAAGKASDICQALAILMATTSDSARKLKIKATQKAMGCRHSRWNK